MDNANAASAVSSGPKNNSLLQRVLSVLVLLPVIIAVGWWNYWASAAVVAGVVVIALLELYGKLTQGGYLPQRWVGLIVGLSLVAVVAVRPLGQSPELLPFVLTVCIIGSLLAALPRARGERTLASWALMLAGALYVGWLFSFLIALRAIESPPLREGTLVWLWLKPGAAWLFTVMAITWLQDTFAYFAGKAFGRTQLAPYLSPKKTWEGAAGGFVGALVGAVGAVFIFCLPISVPQALLLGAVGGVVGPLGDLAESMMKRQIGIKDAGSLIPGHGGVLDRADSLLFCAPVLYYLILFMVR
ncbi:MAG: phosphatidate cytidylyltransferase [Roseiflexaceae bacterium]|nr:phosphatidate cytidylyltransferase [Roseiflexaceae bacterium]